MSDTRDMLVSDGVFLATGPDGFELPILDVTNPRFAMSEDKASIAALYEELHAHSRRFRFVPRFLLNLMLRSAAKKSRLMSAMFGSGGSYLDGISTYVMKLGADNLLPPFDTPMDRDFAAAPQTKFLRMRTQQIASLLAAGLTETLRDAPGRRLDLINIAGGPAIDSLNALLLLRKRRPDLRRRPIAVHVLDMENEGAAFGRNAFRRMQEVDAPLHGLDIDFNHIPYNWTDVLPLRDLMGRLIEQHSLIAASSEGGLFEYGDDEAIVANLEALRAGGRGASRVVGSVTRDDAERRNAIGTDRFKLVPRGLSKFAPLAARAGYAVGDTCSIVMSDQVELRAN